MGRVLNPTSPTHQSATVRLSNGVGLDRLENFSGPFLTLVLDFRNRLFWWIPVEYHRD